MVRKSIVYVGFSTLFVIFLHFLHSGVIGYAKFVLLVDLLSLYQRENKSGAISYAKFVLYLTYKEKIDTTTQT